MVGVEMTLEICMVFLDVDCGSNEGLPYKMEVYLKRFKQNGGFSWLCSDYGALVMQIERSYLQTIHRKCLTNS
jgi:hypothetical protein